MVAISFSVFKDKLLSGKKRQTIRKHNKERVEQMKEHGIQIYWKQRSQDGYKLFDATLVENFEIKFSRWKRGYTERKTDKMMYFRMGDDSEFVTAPKWFADGVARKDGFEDFDDMFDSFCDQYGEEEVLNTTFDVIRFKEVEE